MGFVQILNFPFSSFLCNKGTTLYIFIASGNLCKQQYKGRKESLLLIEYCVATWILRAIIKGSKYYMNRN
jgi:hypothetical protein